MIKKDELDKSQSHEVINKMVTDEEAQQLRVFGQPANDYTKKELIKVIIWQEKENKKRLDRTKKDYEFLGELKRR